MTDGGRRQYHAATFVLEKRTTNWWGGRFSYTLSRAEDNQFGQASTFQTRTPLPRTTTTSTPSTASATSIRRTASSWRRS